MEEVIKEIKQAEQEAVDKIKRAEEKANEISSKLESELVEIRNKYDEKLRIDSEAVLLATKEKIGGLKAAESEKSAIKANKITEKAREKIKPCVDMIFDYIVKEYNE